MAVIDVEKAKSSIGINIIETPVRKALHRRYGNATAFYKCEHIQVTGAFKIRGALNAIASLGVHRSVVTAASTGNHGVACAHAAAIYNKRCVIFLPEHTDNSRRQRIETLGAEIILYGRECGEAENEARRVASVKGWDYISPYNDPHVVAGQGTIGLELLQQIPDLTHVFVAVGGGGLISGIAHAIKRHRPDVQLIGCSPQNSNVMAESVRKGSIQTWSGDETLSASTVGGVEEGAVTFQMCQTLVDQWVDVTELEIKDALNRLEVDELLYVEGAAAVADAAALKYSKTLGSEARIVIILCGSNR